jgi:Flp pilus assembly protein TadG
MSVRRRDRRRPVGAVDGRCPGLAIDREVWSIRQRGGRAICGPSSMHKMLRKLPRAVVDESGQALVLNVLALAVLLGAAAFAIDVGSWYQTKRHDQAIADAAALAGAQALPGDAGQATTLALDYASKNGFNLPASDVAVTSGLASNDTINVTFTHPAPTFFARVLGINSVTIGASASARSDIPGVARWVAPIAVNRLHAMLQCTPPPCTGATQINLADLKQSGSADAAGNFSLLDLTGSSTGNVGNSTLAAWMDNGYDQAMPLGIYTGAPGADFNSGPFDAALSDRIGSEVLFPVYMPPVVQSGANANFNVVGWVGFWITGYSTHGNGGVVYGHFDRFIAQGLEAVDPNSQPDLGARTIQLIR